MVPALVRIRAALFPTLFCLLAFAGCGGSGGDSGGNGIDTGLGFNAAVDESAAPQERVKQYAAAIFSQVQLEPGLQACAKANADKADPAELTKIEGLSGDEQKTASQAFQATFFKGCSLDSGKIMADGANDATGRLVAFTIRDELKATLAAQGNDYTACVSKSLDSMSDDDLVALVQDPEKAKDLGSQIAGDCGATGQ
jgi:hypothetical protein